MAAPGCQISQSKLVSAEARDAARALWGDVGVAAGQQRSGHQRQLEIPTPPSQTIPISQPNCAQAHSAAD